MSIPATWFNEPMQVAVVGHVEWIDFLRVERVPVAGEIVHVREAWSEPGGGGPVAAAQLCKLAGSATFATAFGDDALGRRARSELEKLGLHLEATVRATQQRRAVTFVDADGERTIVVVGDRLGPRGDDALAWELVEDADAVYFCAGDAEALRRARRARVLVATSRVLPLLQQTGVMLDAIVGSARDPSERYRHGDLEPLPRVAVMTEGAAGGWYRIADGSEQRYTAAPVPGPIADTYGAGDSFAAGLTFALGRGDAPADAIALAARCGAAVLSGRGPYAGQLLA